MAPAKGGVPAVAEALAEPYLARLGLKLWDVEFVKEGAGWFLRYYIDREGGVTIDDCEAFSRLIDKRLDEADPIGQSYCLEVSSPGVTRMLRRPWHFEAMAGKRVTARLIRPRDGRREIVGVLRGLEGGDVVLSCGGEDVRIPKSAAAWFRLCDEDLSGGME